MPAARLLSLFIWLALHAMLVSVQIVAVGSEDGVAADLALAHAIESGRSVARDIGGSDPERMAALRIAEYITGLFQGTEIAVKVETDLDYLTKNYPLLAGVLVCVGIALGLLVPLIVSQLCPARPMLLSATVLLWCTWSTHLLLVDCVFLFATGESCWCVVQGPVEETLFLVGKGITYDTGGADIKYGGVMAGMHRDKCGAAAIAGMFHTLHLLKVSKHPPMRL